MQLPDNVHEKIKATCADGDERAGAGDPEAAIRKYRAALELLPEPRRAWEACTWILVAIGDTYFLAGDFGQALEALADAIRCPTGLGNPFIHLRLGQSALELGQQDRAANELTRAYMSGGKEIFESEDPKYFAFLQTRLGLPATSCGVH